MKAYISSEKFGSLLQGIGAILVGIAALIALSQTSDVMKEVLKIQSQAKDIQVAVSLLGDQIKEQKAEKVITGSNIFKLPTPATREAIEKAIIENIPTRPEDGVFIPIQDVEHTVDRLYNASSEAERVKILSKALKVSPFSSAFSSDFAQPAIQRPQNGASSE